nr:MAG TPA: hypothetical protein [Podoviridae sp. ctY3D12]
MSKVLRGILREEISSRSSKEFYYTITNFSYNLIFYQILTRTCVTLCY